MKKDLISIIITTYNREQMLPKAIGCAVAQDHTPIEVIVVDDGSTSSGTKDICQKYPVKYIYQENRGPGAARNTGIQAASGKYIQFLDDDDWLVPQSASTKYQFLVSHPEFHMVYSDLYLADANGATLRCYYNGFHRPMPTGDIYAAILRRNVIPIHCVLWPRYILETIGGFPERTGFEDWECLIRAAEEFSFGFIDVPLGYYRVHANNMTMRQNQENWYSPIYRYVSSSQRFAGLDAKSQAWFLAFFAWKCWLAKDEPLANWLIQQAHQKHKTPFLFFVQAAKLLGQPFSLFLYTLLWNMRDRMLPSFVTNSIFFKHNNKRSFLQKRNH
ncbi:MAG: glycosyltransferase family 2 protein [Anaerolineaceae bacterium]